MFLTLFLLFKIKKKRERMKSNDNKLTINLLIKLFNKSVKERTLEI